MKEGLRWRLLFAVIVLMVGVVYALPSLPVISSSPIKKFLPEEKVSLGLDLQGGIHLVLGVDVPGSVDIADSDAGVDVWRRLIVFLRFVPPKEEPSWDRQREKGEGIRC